MFSEAGEVPSRSKHNRQQTTASSNVSLVTECLFARCRASASSSIGTCAPVEELYRLLLEWFYIHHFILLIIISSIITIIIRAILDFRVLLPTSKMDERENEHWSWPGGPPPLQYRTPASEQQ